MPPRRDELIRQLSAYKYRVSLRNPVFVCYELAHALLHGLETRR